MTFRHLLLLRLAYLAVMPVKISSFTPMCLSPALSIRIHFPYKASHFKRFMSDQSRIGQVIYTDSEITTKAKNLDKNLNAEEKTVVNVVRLVGPSVASVTSYSIPNTNAKSKSSSSSSSTLSLKSPPPNSSNMGSGSSFVISQDGYFITNFHVIQRAYQMQESEKQWDQLYTNITASLPSFFSPAKVSLPRRAQVYIKLATSTDLLPCRIVDVRPEYDIAVLHVNTTASINSNMNLPPAIPIGSSSNLLVGQSVLAIGNPFGLDQTVTKGVVSAMDRSIRGVAGNMIPGCIQTDASINPGNSGGPLLNSSGEVLGVNTMIISTSGSNAGIGFAVPVDGFWKEVEDALHKDRLDLEVEEFEKKRKRKGWLGVKVVSDERLEKSLKKQIHRGDSNHKVDGVFILEVEENSPASKKGLIPLKMEGVKVRVGDRIVAVNGNTIETSLDLRKEFKNRIIGENINITVESSDRERRVVYITLSEKE